MVLSSSLYVEFSEKNYFRGFPQTRFLFLFNIKKQIFDFRRFFNDMWLETMKIELSMQSNADIAIQIDICL